MPHDKRKSGEFCDQCQFNAQQNANRILKIFVAFDDNLHEEAADGTGV
jgi:hypothetical protein